MKLILPETYDGLAGSETSKLLTSFAEAYKATEPKTFCAANLARKFMEAFLTVKRSDFSIACVAGEMACWVVFEYPKFSNKKN